MSTASRPGEFDLIARYFAPLAAPGGLGLLDDAAILTPPAGHDLVLSKDALVADVHFFADDPPEAIARKALRVNLSDLAAKGARPLGFLLGLGLPAEWDEEWLAAFARGLGADAEAYACPLLGGDTVAGKERLFLSVTVIGAVPTATMVRRAGGRAGDRLFVTGTIGDAAIGLKVILAEHAARRGWMPDAADRAYVIDRYRLPQPRNALAEAVRSHASAAMDVSDGLVGDARKLAAASGCGLEIDLSSVPLSPPVTRAVAIDPGLLRTAVTGGDDYEILCAIPGEHVAAFRAAAGQVGVTVTEIGALTAAGERITGRDGALADLGSGSFRHF